MKYLWLFLLPLIFVPNLGFSQNTQFGNLEFSDYVIFPYITSLLIALSGSHIHLDRTTKFLGSFFITISCLSILSIFIYYNYTSYENVILGCFAKLAKLSTYSFAAVLTYKVLHAQKNYAHFDLSLLFSLLVVCVSIFARSHTMDVISNQTIFLQYEGDNQISVLIAILATYLWGKMFLDEGRRSNRWLHWIVLFISLAAILGTAGRGGWMACFFGIAYLLFKARKWTQMSYILFSIFILILWKYQTDELFKRNIDVTLNPTITETLFQEKLGIDTGYRLSIFLSEFPKIFDAPLIGQGFFHRGGKTPLFSTGSHNFWLQMFLETGIIGGFLILFFLRRTWLDTYKLRNTKTGIAIRGATIAAVVGGMSGEYFYGGMTLLAFLFILAPVIEPKCIHFRSHGFIPEVQHH